MKKSLFLILCIGFCFGLTIKPCYSLPVTDGVQQELTQSNKKKKRWEKRIQRFKKKAEKRRILIGVLTLLTIVSFGVAIGFLVNINASLGCRPVLTGLYRAAIFGLIGLGLTFILSMETGSNGF